jgi:ribosomal protein S27AE
MLDVKTSWSVDELFDQAIASVSDDTKWLVQTQSDQTLVLRREKSMGAGRWVGLVVLIFITLFTCGIALLLIPVLFVNLKNQQVVINVKPVDGYVKGRITYTAGAKKMVNTLVSSMPRPDETRQPRSTGIHDHAHREKSQSSERLGGERQSRREHQTHDEYEPADTIQCRKCGAKNNPNAQFCASCGSSLAQASSNRGVCSRCHTNNKAGARFCINCGNSLDN